MAKTTKTAEQLEREATRTRRDELISRRLDERWRHWEALEAEAAETPLEARRRRLFPWRVRIERLT
jgi:hypothetical protein